MKFVGDYWIGKIILTLNHILPKGQRNTFKITEGDSLI